VLAIPVFYFLFTNLMSTPEPAAGAGFIGYVLGLPLMGKLLCGTFGLFVPGVLIWSWRVGTRREFQMMLAAVILITFNTVFWSLFEQAGSSLTLFADRNTNLSVFGLFTLSAPQTQQFNSLAIITLAPVMGMLWGWMAKRGWEPSITVKFALGLIGVGGDSCSWCWARISSGLISRSGWAGWRASTSSIRLPNCACPRWACR
jgi:POT family proton-dependent oligopeptide transporter